jgi:hypothetical protein
MPGKRFDCRLVFANPVDGYDKANWPEMVQWLVANMIRLEQILSGPLEKIKQALKTTDLSKEPVQDPEQGTVMTEQQIRIFTSNDGQAHLEVALDQETAWLSLDQMTGLFDRDKPVISRHISNVLKEGELDRSSVVAKNATTAADGKTYQVDYFNLRKLDNL